VLAVVREQAVTVFAETRTRALNGFDTAVTALWVLDDEDVATGSEPLERNFLDGAAMQRRAKACVVNDLAAADIDTVMAVAVANSDQMRAERQVVSRLLKVGAHGGIRSRELAKRGGKKVRRLPTSLHRPCQR
jgi:hypothetical protein